MYTRWSLINSNLPHNLVLEKSGPKYEKHNNLIDGVSEVGDTNHFFNDSRVSKEKQ